MAQSKTPTDEDKRIARPLTAAALADYGELDVPQPTGAFRPTGAWTQTYRIWLTGGPWDNYRGYVKLHRSGAAGEAVELKVTEVRVMPRTRAAHETRVSLSCRADALATPLSWQLMSRVYDVKTGEDFADAGVEQSGETRNDAVRLTTLQHRRDIRIAGPWTCNWSLFEAIQRLPRTPGHALQFTLLDELDERKPDQRLICRGREALQFAGAQIMATRYDQIGHGGLPCRYYVGADGRLLLAHTDLRAYILDSGVMQTHEKKIKYLAAKEMR